MSISGLWHRFWDICPFNVRYWFWFFGRINTLKTCSLNDLRFQNQKNYQLYCWLVLKHLNILLIRLCNCITYYECTVMFCYRQNLFLIQYLTSKWTVVPRSVTQSAHRLFPEKNFWLSCQRTQSAFLHKW